MRLIEGWAERRAIELNNDLILSSDQAFGVSINVDCVDAITGFSPPARGSANDALPAAAAGVTGPVDPHRDKASPPGQESPDAPGDVADTTTQTWPPTGQSPSDGLWSPPPGAPAGRGRPGGTPAKCWGRGRAQTAAVARPAGRAGSS